MQKTTHFSANGKNLKNLTLYDYWNWAYSDLSNNAFRSMLAEFIVAASLCTTKAKTNSLLSKEGYRISVKAASFTQSQTAEYPDHIIFQDISLSSYDVYIFCLYKGFSSLDSPLNLDLWEFYIISSNHLIGKITNSKSLTLPTLITLKPLQCNYFEIKETMKKAMNI